MGSWGGIIIIGFVTTFVKTIFYSLQSSYDWSLSVASCIGRQAAICCHLLTYIPINVRAWWYSLMMYKYHWWKTIRVRHSSGPLSVRIHVPVEWQIYNLSGRRLVGQHCVQVPAVCDIHWGGRAVASAWHVSFKKVHLMRGQYLESSRTALIRPPCSIVIMSRVFRIDESCIFILQHEHQYSSIFYRKQTFIHVFIKFNYLHRKNNLLYFTHNCCNCLLITRLNDFSLFCCLSTLPLHNGKSWTQKEIEHEHCYFGPWFDLKASCCRMLSTLMNHWCTSSEKTNKQWHNSVHLHRAN